jgi:Fe2+ or Zn2+ uptake regulation protein
MRCRATDVCVARCSARRDLWREAARDRLARQVPLGQRGVSSPLTMSAGRAFGDTELEQLLRAAGLRSTRPRLLVLRFLRERGGHHSADEIQAALDAADEHLLRGSVYHVLAKLMSRRLVMQADVGPGRALYESGSPWHHHFVCRACEVVLDVACVDGAQPCLSSCPPGAQVDETQIIFRGLCAACSAE